MNELSEEYLGLGGQEKLKDSDPSTEPSAEAREAQDFLACVEDGSVGEFERKDIVKDAVKFAHALVDKDAALVEAQRERDDLRVCDICHGKGWWMSKEGAQIGCDCQPTPECINALPEQLRRHIHDLETRVDPAGDLQRIAFLQDTVATLQADLAAMRGVLKTHGRHRGGCSACFEFPVEGDECNCGLDAALSSAPGAAWLATAREVVEALAGLRNIAGHIGEELLPPEGDALWEQHMIDLRSALDVANALLARPEVQRLW